jgi:hypothetical protein
MNGLSEDERAHILLEERYRADVRRQLDAERAAADNRFRKVLNFFGTPLGIWMLSTIAVGLITFGYSLARDQADEAKRNRAEVRQIDAEIVGRLESMRTALEQIRSNSTESVLFANFEPINNAPALGNVSEAYKNTKMQFLLSTLYFDVTPNERSELSAASASWGRILAIREAALEAPNENLNGAALGIERELLKNFRLDRWRQADGTFALDVPLSVLPSRMPKKP